MKRSVGLILSAIVLGLAACGMVLTAVLMVVAGFAMQAHPTTPTQPSFLHLFMYGTALVFAAMAAWAITTVVGLLFLRTWARYSILVIGGMMSALGAMSVLGILVALLSGQLATPGAHPGVSNQQMQIVFAVVAAGYGAVAAVGVWWLVYFNQRSTKDLFVHRDRFDPASGLPLPLPAPSRRPTAITILGCLILLGAVSCAVLAFLPLPVFFLGFILTGGGGHALYTAFALVSAATGVGLLRLYPAARIAATAFFLLGCVNTLMSLLPWYQAQFRLYMEQFRAMFPLPANVPASAFQYPAAQMIFYGAFGLVLNAFLIWLLHRHRTAFHTPPPMERSAL